MNKELVYHPKHYQHPCGVEIIEITRHLDNNRGAAVKYCGRLGEKDDYFQELGKAAFYAEDLANVHVASPAPDHIRGKVDVFLDWVSKNEAGYVYDFLGYVLTSKTNEAVVNAGKTLRETIERIQNENNSR